MKTITIGDADMVRLEAAFEEDPVAGMITLWMDVLEPDWNNLEVVRPWHYQIPSPQTHALIEAAQRGLDERGEDRWAITSLWLNKGPATIPV